MAEIEFSICIDPTQDTSDLQRLLAKSHIRYRLQTIAWDDYIHELMQVAIYGRGPDISQSGAPLVSDLVAMNGIRPFEKSEIAMLGGAGVFHRAVWDSSRRVNEERVWAVPWLADPRAIFYWRDMLESAGVTEESAFESFDQMEDTLARLRANGVQTPWVIPTGRSVSLLQVAASWIWACGGDFVSWDGRKALIDQPEALAGLRVYYGLHRYLPETDGPIDISEAVKFFQERKAAVTMGSPRIGMSVLEHLPEQRTNLGIALPPGPPLVGGSSLVIWKHTKQVETTFALVRYLTSKEAQVEYLKQTGYLPSRRDALAEPPFATDPFFQGLARALEHGRPFPVVRLGGLLEGRLILPLSGIWEDIHTDPGRDIDQTMVDHLAPFAKRINIMLGSTG